MNDTTNRHARAAIRDLLTSFKGKRFGQRLHRSLLRAGMMKDRCRASGKLSDMY